MLSVFQRPSVYVKIYPDEIEVTNLKNGESIRQQSPQPFSSPRLLIAGYSIAEELARQILGELGLSKKSLKILIQQKHAFADGVSESEKRILRDLYEQIGGVAVFIATDDRPISNEEALSIIQDLKWEK